MRAVYTGTLLVLAIAKKDVVEINALALPATNRALARAWVTTRDRLLVLLGQLAIAARKGDAAAVARITGALNANGAAGHRLAGRLEMKVCSVGG
jgi:hypothetical protein